MKTVKIKQCYGNYAEWVSNHRTDCNSEAIKRAIKKHFGSGAAFYRDHELSGDGVDYGQVGYSIGGGVHSMHTGRVSVVVVEQ